MKRSLPFLLIILCLLLCACGHSHEWEEATCTQAKTCTVCGETEGEALPHSWEEATCTQAKTCSVCGETEGEALPHSWEEATYTRAKTCAVCGETEGEALPAVFEEMNLSQYTMNLSEHNKEEFDYITSNNRGGETTGKAAFEWIVPYDAEQDRQLGDGRFFVPEGIQSENVDMTGFGHLFENKEGYEWRGVRVNMKFPSNWYHMQINFRDYYSYDELDNAPEIISKENSRYVTLSSAYPLEYQGDSYKDCLIVTLCYYPARDMCSFCAFLRVPVGYDGAIAGLLDTRGQESVDGFNTNEENTEFSGEDNILMRLK